MEVIPVPTLSLPVTCGGGEGFGCIFPEKSRIQSHPLPADPTDEATWNRVQVRDHGRGKKKTEERQRCAVGVSLPCVKCSVSCTSYMPEGLPSSSSSLRLREGKEPDPRDAACK